MNRRVDELIKAFGPIMNPLQAEGFLHVTAFTRSKSLDSLTADDWPYIEESVREALGTMPDEELDQALERMREAFLHGEEGAPC